MKSSGHFVAVPVPIGLPVAALHHVANHRDGIPQIHVAQVQRGETKTQQICRVGEFLVAEIDAKVGGFGVVPENLEGSIVSSHYFLFVVDDVKLVDKI